MKSIISIIIPIYNRIEITKKGLSFIDKAVQYYNSTYEPRHKIEVVIVDDGSTDKSGQWVTENYPEFTVIYGDGSLWWTGAVNKGIQYSINKFENLQGVILQNDDIMVENTWIFNLLEVVQNHPSTLVGCATVIKEQEDLIEYGGRNINLWSSKEKKINYKALRSQFNKGYVTSSFDLYGRGMYIPLEVFQKIGLFDQKRFKHRGDMDIPLRAKKAGFNLLVSYDAIVYEYPQLTYGLDQKKSISFSEAYKLLTDFRSSSNFKFIFNYSRIATCNPFQFILFFSATLFYNIRRVSWKFIRQFV